jgi:hypothetical protein
MIRATVFAILWTVATAVSVDAAPDSWSGVVSDTICGATHQAMASQIGVDDKECTIQCVKSGAKWVLATKVDGKNKNMFISNVDFPKLEDYAGDQVTITGELKSGAIVIAKIDRTAAAK